MIGVEIDCPFTPAMLKKVAYAGVQSASFSKATKDLEALAEVVVSRERVQRWTKRIGSERVSKVEEQAGQYQSLPLPEQRKAFVADGAASNWTIHRKHFSHYTPVVDFTHAICYVYAAAMAGRTCKAAWCDYVQWAQWLWEGATDRLIGAVAARSEQLGSPPDGDESSPAAIVARTLGYLKNQRTRMKYAEYRKLGLPITSSHIESTIKQINRRVKGTEKFWDQGAEPLLQLAADPISETNDFDRFWNRRRHSLPTMRSYQAAA